MRVFLTGATGFIGSYLVPELLQAGHHVVGLTRSAASAEALTRAGAVPLQGDVNDADVLREAVAAADGVIHAAFNHDFAALAQHSAADRQVIETLGAALAGTDRPLIVSSGTGLADRRGPLACETDPPFSGAAYPRAATEDAAAAVCARGVRAMVLRLAQVHDTRHQGRIALHIQLARQHGHVAYVGAGENRLAAVHVTDAVRLYRLALEHGEAGRRYHAVAEDGVPLYAIAEVIGARLRLPVGSISPDAAAGYFGGLAGLAQMDLPASSALTRQRLDWTPTGPDLLSDLRALPDDVGH